jgi:ribosome biogenesis GTP-binding protein YlqF
MLSRPMAAAGSGRCRCSRGPAGAPRPHGRGRLAVAAVAEQELPPKVAQRPTGTSSEALLGMARQYTRGRVAITDASLDSLLNLDELIREDNGVGPAPRGGRSRGHGGDSGRGGGGGGAAGGGRAERAAARARADKLDAALTVHTVQWYPGHIARAERQLKEQLKMVDVVLEVRDARIPLSTCHPQVGAWVGAKPRLVVMNRVDMVSKRDKREWEEWFAAAGQKVFWTDAAGGRGAERLHKAAVAAARSVNEKRARRGLAPRATRACVIGFPNIGKSALINRLLGRRVVESAAKPGVTRALRWVSLGDDLDLLDAPGVIPAAFDDQIAAQRLAMCNDIGEAAYVDSLVAAALVARVKRLPGARGLAARLERRYHIDPWLLSAEEFVAAVAAELFGGDKEKAGRRILGDYRNGHLGEFALEVPADADGPSGGAAAAGPAAPKAVRA